MLGMLIPSLSGIEIVDGLDLKVVVVDVPIVRRYVRIQILSRDVRQQDHKQHPDSADHPSGNRADPVVSIS
jgi:hypothetical protein